jgi:hypothetical protein
VLPVDKRVLEPQQVVIIILVQLRVEQIQYRHFHHALIEVRGTVLDHLDRNNFLRLQVLTLHYLTEGALAEDVQNQIPVSRQSVSYWCRLRSM